MEKVLDSRDVKLTTERKDNSIAPKSTCENCKYNIIIPISCPLTGSSSSALSLVKVNLWSAREQLFVDSHDFMPHLCNSTILTSSVFEFRYGRLTESDASKETCTLPFVYLLGVPYADND